MRSFLTAPSTGVMLYTCTGNPGTGPVSNVSGNHLAGKSNTDVQGVNFFGIGYTLNQGITNFFPNIIAISYQAQLESITADDLAPFPNLIHLSLRGNMIQTLDANLFQHTTQLIFVEFSENLIIRVGTNIFAGLNALISAYFNLNICIDFYGNTPTGLLALQQTLEVYCQPCPSEEETNVLRARIRQLENQLVLNSNQCACESH